jgi:hypothetical protein
VQEPRQFGAFLDHYRKFPQPTECVVVDAAPIEPVSSVEIPRKLGKYWEFRPFWTLRGLISEQFQKFAGKIPVQGNWEFILRKWENAKRRNGAATVFGTANAQSQRPTMVPSLSPTVGDRWFLRLSLVRWRAPRHRAVQQWGLALTRGVEFWYNSFGRSDSRRPTQEGVGVG